MNSSWACPSFVPAPPGSRPHPHPAARPAARPAACLLKRASRHDESKTSFTFTKARMRTLVLPIATAARHLLMRHSGPLSICSFMLPCAPRSGKELVERWSRQRSLPCFLPLGVYMACTATARPVPPLERKRGRPSTLLHGTDRVRAGAAGPGAFEMLFACGHVCVYSTTTQRPPLKPD